MVTKLADKAKKTVAKKDKPALVEKVKRGRRPADSNSKTIRVHLIFTEQMDKMLATLAENAGSSKSDVVRHLIANAYANKSLTNKISK